VADDSYLEQTGSVTFQIGESEQTDTLEIRDNDHWNAEALQWVQLQRDETDNFILGELWRTTVVTLDDDLFPGQVREYYITGQISLPEHVPYEPKQLYQAVSHYFQGEMPGSRKASMRYRLDASDLELTLDPQVPQLVHMKLGVAKHMAEVALKLAHALQAPRTTGDGPGDLDLLYTAELEATKAGTDDTEKAVTLDVKGETSPLNPTKAAAGFIQGSGFPQTADTARLSTVWAMMMFLWDLRGSDAFLAMAIQAYASVNWTVERLFTLVAINFVLHQGGEEGEDGEEGLLQRAAKGVGSGLMQVVKEATAPVLDGSAPGGTEELPPIVVDDEEGFLNRGGGNEWILFLMSGIFVANIFIYQLLKAWYTKLEMGATVRTALRTEAINCMLQLNPEEQERIDAGVALNVITDRIQQISEGWKAFIEFIGQFFLTITMVLMVSYLGSEISGPEKSLGVVFAVLLVVINLLIFMCRFNRSVELDDDCIHHEDEWKHSLLESTSKRGLVTMYRQGRFVATEFEEKLEEHSEAASSFERYNENTEFLLEWLSTIILVFTYLFCGDQVLQGEMKMGTFVVLVETLVKFSTHIASAFEQIQITTSTFSSIVQLSSLLNAQSRRRDLLHSRERSNQLFQEYLEEYGPAAKDKIIVHPDTTVEYTDRDGDHLPVKRPILLPGTQIEQGQIVAVRAPGRNAAGKQTFLKALAQVLCPIKGFVHYPENLHVRLIPAEPQILTGTVLRNLRFGNQAQPPHSDADLQAVCLLFKLSPELYEEQEEGAGIGTRLVGTNGEKLAMTDRVKIAVIRSMLSSVDLLLIDHVLDPLDDQEVTEILDVLKLFVQERGLPCLTHDMKADLKLRKLKTVVIATRSQVIEGLVHNPMLLPSQNSCPGTPTSGTPTSPGTPKSSTKKWAEVKGALSKGAVPSLNLGQASSKPDQPSK